MIALLNFSKCSKCVNVPYLLKNNVKEQKALGNNNSSCLTKVLQYVVLRKLLSFYPTIMMLSFDLTTSCNQENSFLDHSLS